MASGISEVSRRPARVEVDLSAIAANARAVKRMIGAGCSLAAVVKANGYGLGAVPVATAALLGGAEYLAVATVDEGIELRLGGIAAPVLVMSYVPPEEAEAAVRFQLTVTLHNLKTAEALERAAVDLDRDINTVPVHIKVDTGLGRYGCLPGDLVRIVVQVRNLPHLLLEGLMTHFAEADSADLAFTERQVNLFQTLRREAADAGAHFKLVHAANSAGALALPEARFNMVRAGIVLYGLLPAEHLGAAIDLKPVLSLMSRLARVFPVKAGDTIGYGRTWTASADALIGLVPVGYADGYRRALSNRAEVLVGGRRCPVAGRVSMDQLAVDLGSVGAAREGDEVVLIGRQGEAEITATELAERADTISYEILTGLGLRLPRVYFWGGQAVGHRDLLGGTFALPEAAEAGALT